MSDRLTDEQVRWHADAEWRATQARPSLTLDVFDAEMAALAREVQMWRALVYGGPCETCFGKGEMPHWGVPPPPCPAGCIDGHKPGIVERLEAIRTRHLSGDGMILGNVNAILADLRAAGNQGGPTP